MAARFLVTGGDGNWGSTNNWSATSGGASGASVPSTSDDVTFDVNSGATNLTINTSARTAASLTITVDYTGTLTFSQNLTVVGSVTLGANMVFAGASTLAVSGTGTFTSNGVPITVPFAVSGATATVTLADAMVCSALLTLNPNTSVAKTINGFSITANASLTLGSNGNSSITGTTTITFTAGTFTGTTSCTLRLTLTLNGAAYTLSGTLIYSTGTLTYTAGTATVTGFTLTVGGAATSLAISGVTWPTLNFSLGTATITLLEDINVTNFNYSPNTSATITIAGAFDINVAGNMVGGGSTNGITTSTTAKIRLTGTGQWSHSNTSSLRVDLDFDTAGTITVSGTVYYNTRTMKWVAGTLAGASSPRVRIAISGTTLDFGGASVPWIFWVGGLITVNMITELVLASSGGLLIDEQDVGTEMTWRANLGGAQAKLTVSPGAIIDVGCCDFTDIDCSDGDELFVYKGALTNTTNITLLTPYTSPFSGGGGGGPTATGSFG